jgi:hypothetical protein
MEGLEYLNNYVGIYIYYFLLFLLDNLSLNILNRILNIVNPFKSGGTGNFEIITKSSSGYVID